MDVIDVSAHSFNCLAADLSAGSAPDGNKVCSQLPGVFSILKYLAEWLD